MLWTKRPPRITFYFRNANVCDLPPEMMSSGCEADLLPEAAYPNVKGKMTRLMTR